MHSNSYETGNDGRDDEEQLPELLLQSCAAAAEEGSKTARALAACVDLKLLQAKGAGGQKERALRSLRESIPHALKLQQLRKADRRLGKEAILCRKRYGRAAEQLYHVLALFALVMSGIIAAVARASIFSCDARWGLVLGTLLVAAAAGWGACDRLSAMSHHRAEAHTSQARQNAVYDGIDEMLLRGAACNLDGLQPRHSRPSPGLARSRHTSCFQRRSAFSPHAVLALLFLASLCAISIASVNAMLCGPACKCSAR